MKTITKTDFIRARIEPNIKKESEKILKEIGLSMSDAVGIFLRQVNLNKGLPFSVNIPNKTTKKALRENLSGAKIYKNTKDIFSELSK
jgi:DNA-damage-inducible protein J